MGTPFPHKIISGGQTGADRAGLDFAIANDLDHGGYCPRGRRSEDGVIPTHYRMIETTDWKYRTRTIFNVREADATIIFNQGRDLSTGCALTVQSAKTERKPCLLLRDFTVADKSAQEQHARLVIAFIARHRPAVLNIAGNREESAPGISAHVMGTMVLARELAREGVVTTGREDADPLLPEEPRQGQLAL
jgi:hypothetical protein